MEKLVWQKVKHFLEELRCEDLDRESRVETDELQAARQNLYEKSVAYQQSITDIQKEEQEKIKDYVEALKDYSFEECQQAYLQGMLDCMLALCGSGVLKPQKALENTLRTLKEQ